MPIRISLIALLALFASLPLNAQQSPSPSSPTPSPFAGVWRGQFDNLPGIDLVITDEGGGLQGAILFYLHIRKDLNSPYTATSGLPEPIFNVRLDGQTLNFQVSHRRAHPPRTLHDPPLSFHLKLTGPDQAAIVNQNDGAPVLVMKRSDY
jgi:hypothetical protein